MLNIVVNMCEKFREDRLWNDRALGNFPFQQQQDKEQRSYRLETRFRV